MTGFAVFSEDTWSELGPWESQFDTQIRRIEKQQIEIRRYLHAHPEPSGEEVQTSQFLAGRLSELGLEPRICRSDEGRAVGLVADLTLGNPSPDARLIGLRADIDALRMPDEKTVDYASKNPGVAHACGHDAHASIVLGVALAGVGGDEQATSSARTHDFGARLRLLFQPAEETSSGAHWLVDQGAMEGVDAILGLHVDPERPVGQVGIRYGILTANCDDVEITVEGHGGHAARPHHTVDPIAAAAHLIGALHEFLPRAVDSRTPSVFTIGKITGGYASNVIPERVELFGTLRTTDTAHQQILRSRIEEICAGAARSSGTRIQVRLCRPLKSVENHPRIAAALEAASQRVVGADNIVAIDQPSMGADDFSVYLDHAPGAMLRLGCAAGDREAPFLHSPLFDVDERALALGTRILIRAAVLLSIGSRADSSFDAGG